MTEYRARMKQNETDALNAYRREAPEILNEEGAARFLGVSVRVLADNAERLGVPFRAIGRVRLYSREALVDWVRGAKFSQ